MTQSLEQRVSAALANDAITPAELETLIDSVEDGINHAERNAAQIREAAMDPSLSPDLSAARQAMEDAAFLVGRLRTQLPRLERRLAQVVAAEQHARWLQEYNEVIAKRDAAVEQFKQYPELVNRLLDL